MDARPIANALANNVKGGGSESSSNYLRSEVCLLFWIFFHFVWQNKRGLSSDLRKGKKNKEREVFVLNICDYTLLDSFPLFLIMDFGIMRAGSVFGNRQYTLMRESLPRLREYVDTHGTTSSDGTSSFSVSSAVYH